MQASDITNTSDARTLAEFTPEGTALQPVVPIEIYTQERVSEFDLAESELARVLAQRR